MGFGVLGSDPPVVAVVSLLPYTMYRKASMSTKSVSTMSSVIMTFWKKNPSVIAMVFASVLLWYCDGGLFK